MRWKSEVEDEDDMKDSENTVRLILTQSTCLLLYCLSLSCPFPVQPDLGGAAVPDESSHFEIIALGLDWSQRQALE